MSPVDPQLPDSLVEAARRFFGDGHWLRDFALSASSSAGTWAALHWTGRRNRRATDRGIEVDNTGKMIDNAGRLTSNALAFLEEINKFRKEDHERHDAELAETRRIHALALAEEKAECAARIDKLEKRVKDLEGFAPWAPPAIKSVDGG